MSVFCFLGRLFIFMLSFGIFPCKASNDVTIEAEVPNLPASTIYLVESSSKRVIDSAVYDKTHFKFTIKDLDTYSTGYPLTVSIIFYIKGEMTWLVFKNAYLSTPDKMYGSTSFVLEKGKTIIAGNGAPIYKRTTPKLDISAGKENEVFFKTQFTSFDMWDIKNNVQRNTKVAELKKMIKLYPGSGYLLSQIEYNKREFNKADLKGLLGTFSQDMQRSVKGRSIEKYVNAEDAIFTHLFDVDLLNSDGVKSKAINRNSDVNIVVLWASWCQPCIQEIPHLKKLYKEFGNNQRFNMVSVSIDAKGENWRSALKKYNMSWKQLRVPDELLKSKNDLFHFNGSIPFILIIDKKGELINKIIGFDENNLDVIRKSIAR